MGMYKYRIFARRDATEEWTDWNTANDVNEIRAKMEYAEACGYEAMVEDFKLKYWEKEYSRGHMLFNPVRVGDFRYILHDKGEESYIEKYQVGSITYDGEKWYVTPSETNLLYEVDGDYCLRPGFAKARLEAILKEFE